MYEDLETESKSSNLLQSVRVNYSRSEDRKRVSEITFLKHDDRNRLIERTEYIWGEFSAKYVYKYNALSQVISRVSYVYNLDKAVSVITYSYNKEGNVIKEIDEDFRSNEKKMTEYRYEYEYYK